MSSLLHLKLSDKWFGFHIMTEVTVRKEDYLGHHQVGAREELVVIVAASPTREVPDVFRKNSHVLVTLLLCQFRYLD